MAAWGLLLRRNYNTGLRKWAYNLSGFNKYGLYHDDVLDEEDQDVAEAVRRLPEDLRNGRTFRIVRALQLSLEHDILPKEEWTNFEDDVKYLAPYIEQVKKEREEKLKWHITH